MPCWKFILIIVSLLCYINAEKPILYCKCFCQQPTQPSGSLNEDSVPKNTQNSTNGYNLNPNILIVNQCSDCNLNLCVERVQACSPGGNSTTNGISPDQQQQAKTMRQPKCFQRESYKEKVFIIMFITVVIAMLITSAVSPFLPAGMKAFLRLDSDYRTLN
ncbi:hypothetical protein MIR68_007286 [Amoeboaphelidium protococcarum]|nr:hypothetical protein MIR68_007286 [Amoeboaphelidium protococcarum]